MEAAGEVATAQLVVAANRQLEGGPRGAEQIDGGPEPRVDVVPERNTGSGIGRSHRNKQSGRKLTGRESVVDAVVTEPEIEREAFHLPLVLREHTQLHFLPRL